MGLAQSNYLSGIWPMGKISPVAGTPAKLTANVGTQDPKLGAAKQYPARIRQFIFSTPGAPGVGANTGNVYILYNAVPGTTTKLTTNSVLLVIPPGQEMSLPHGMKLDGVGLSPDNFTVDVDNTGDGVYVSGLIE